MACNCYNANNSHKEIKTYTQLLTTLPFRVFLMFWIHTLYTFYNTRFSLPQSLIFSCNMDISYVHASLNRIHTVDYFN